MKVGLFAPACLPDAIPKYVVETRTDLTTNSKLCVSLFRVFSTDFAHHNQLILLLPTVGAVQQDGSFRDVNSLAFEGTCSILYLFFFTCMIL